jgi:hypothetical protein
MQRLDGLLEKAADAAYQALLAIERDDAVAVRFAVDQLRYIRARTQAPAQVVDNPGEHATRDALERMRCAAEALDVAEPVIQHWTRQNVQAMAGGELPEEGEQWQRLIDLALPAAWDFDADLFMVFGDYQAAIREQLRQRGQRRILFVGHDSQGSAPTDDPDTLVVTSDAQVHSHLGALKRPYPNRLAKLDLHNARPNGFETSDLDALIHKNILALWTNFKTTQEFGRRWVEQGIGNIPAVVQHQSLSVLDGRFRGMPALLVSPGPSLDKNIHLLREAQGKALLLAPLQTLRRLHLAGVRPDFVLVLDPLDLTTEPYDFFKEVPDEILPDLIVGLGCHPNVIRKFKRVYFFSAGGPVDHWMQDILGEPLIQLGAPSVALAALMLARHWRCNTITLVGQDLALDGGRQYAQDANLFNVESRKLLPLRGYYGGTVQSPSDYYLFHHQFELIAQDMAQRDPDLRLFNCTEGGAYIKGFEHAPLRALIDDHVLKRSAEQHAAATSIPLGMHTSCAFRASAIAHLQAALSTIDTASALARRCLRLSHAVRPGSTALKRLGADEKMLRTLVQKIKGFGIVYQDDIDEAIKASARAKNLHDNLTASRTLYRVILQGCELIRPMVEQALHAMGAGVAHQRSLMGIRDEERLAAHS